MMGAAGTCLVLFPAKRHSSFLLGEPCGKTLTPFHNAQPLSQASSVQEAMRLRIRLSAEAPNRNLHRFKGQATILSEQFARTPLSPGSDKMVWSGNGTAAGG